MTLIIFPDFRMLTSEAIYIYKRFFFNLKNISKKYLKGRKFMWEVHGGSRGGFFGDGADLEHKQCKAYLLTYTTLSLLYSICDFWLFNFVNRKVFEFGRPKNIPALKRKLIQVFQAQYMNWDSKTLPFLLFLVHSIPYWWAWAEFECAVHVALPKVHKPVEIISAKQKTGSKSLLS